MNNQEIKSTILEVLNQDELIQLTFPIDMREHLARKIMIALLPKEYNNMQECNLQGPLGDLCITHDDESYYCKKYVEAMHEELHNKLRLYYHTKKMLAKKTTNITVKVTKEQFVRDRCKFCKEEQS